ncbi:MAG TPA: metallophosphoesterase [Verrucomicrobiaceae bacterium]|jgi:Icc-related predicted phosphoesterase
MSKLIRPDIASFAHTPAGQRAWEETWRNILLAIRAPKATLRRIHAMRLLFVADLHYSLKQFDWLLAHAHDYEVAAIGGDLLDLSSALDADVQITIVERYLRLLRQKTRIIVCSGNHDGDSRNAADESIAEWLGGVRADGLHVDGDGFDLGDARITVCPWWDGHFSRGELEALLEREAARVKRRWIWIHHAPPEGARTSWTGRKFVGDEFLRAWIDRFQPDLVLSGHIHNAPFFDQGSWIDQIGRTWVFNPGRQLGPQPATITVDLAAWTAEWISLEDRSLRDLRIAQCCGAGRNA